MKTCPQCGHMNEDNAHFCSNCRYDFTASTQPDRPLYYQQNTSYPSDNAFDACGPEGKSRGIAALLAIIFTGLGIHYFYLGKTAAGLINIALTFVSCGLWSFINLIQGILMLFMTNAQFREKYVLSTATFPVF